MRTARLLPVSPGMHWSWGEGCTWSGGVYLVQGVPGPKGGVPGRGGGLKT